MADIFNDDAPWLSAAQAIERYIDVSARFPDAAFPPVTRMADTLSDLVDDIDVFVLDGFGVLNVGQDPVPSAVTRIPALRAAGKTLRVLTNGASLPTARTVEKYRRFGIDFTREEVVSSRDALTALLASRSETCWGFSALENSALRQLCDEPVWLRDDPDDYARVDGFVLLATGDWNDARHRLMCRALAERPRPLLVGNPDLVAPMPGGVTREPGLFAHLIADAGLATPVFAGKPFANAFAKALESLPADVDPTRVAMVGDTLHTDILGGAAAGWKTVLVSDHGLMREADIEEVIGRSGVRPDWIVSTT
ncbi:MAG: hypothetical protein CSB44_04450 [Gammaproteobacteria bacterium]|nr:MAG: hypothetical protein CSB44_04450 [Gammaproteobacteria bacterium]